MEGCQKLATSFFSEKSYHNQIISMEINQNYTHQALSNCARKTMEMLVKEGDKRAIMEGKVKPAEDQPTKQVP